MTPPAPARPGIDPEIRRQILAGFRGTVPPFKPSLGYRLTLAGAAVVMLLMPVVYAAVVGGLVWLTLGYLRLLDFSFFLQGPGLLMLPAVLIPAGLGTVIVIGLVKPLFGGGGGQTRLQLDPAREPLLFEFVGRLCRTLGAPVPKEIHVNCDVNASASLRRGLLSLLDTDDMVLVLGLPLVQGLTLQQLAGVIAHETGHFSQKAGLRLSLVIQVMSGFLHLLVSRRDPLDESIRRHAEESGAPLVKGVLYSVSAVIWICRWTLWGTMLAGYTVSAYVSRHLEYDADRYLVRFAGFEAFASSLREMFALSAAHEASLEELSEQWRERRLADSLSQLVLANRESKAQEIADRFEAGLADEKAGIFDSHPPTRKRIARAQLESGAGVFSSVLPAGALFADLPGIEQAASLQFYLSVLGRQIRFADLVPVQAMRELKQQGEEERAAYDSYFQNPPLRAMRLPGQIPACVDREEGIRRLEEARRIVAESAADHRRAKADFLEAAKRRVYALRAGTLLRAGYSIDAASFKLPAGDLGTALRAAKQAQVRMTEIDPILAGYQTHEADRLEAALALYQHPAVAADLPGVTLAADEMTRLLGCGDLLASWVLQVVTLREDWNVLDTLVRDLEAGAEPPKGLREEIHRTLALVREHLKVYHRALREHPYPFEHGFKGTALVQYIVPALPAEGDFEGLQGMVSTAINRTEEVQARLLSRLAWVASKVEASLGMAPLVPSAAGPAAEAAPEIGEEEIGGEGLVPRARTRPADGPMPVYTLPAEPAAPAEAPLETPPPAPPATPAIPAIPATPRAVVTVKIAESKADAVESRELFRRYFRHPLEWPRRHPWRSGHLHSPPGPGLGNLTTATWRGAVA